MQADSNSTAVSHGSALQENGAKDAQMQSATGTNLQAATPHNPTTGSARFVFVLSVDMTPAQDSSPHWPKGAEAFGWSRFLFDDEDVARLRAMVEETATRRTKVGSSHVKGAHYTVQELSRAWSIGVDKIRELFQNEPGVIKIQKPPREGRRVYTTLRIPENVAERVQRRLS